MAEAAVTFLLENVTQLLKSYVDLIAGAESELEQLQKDLKMLKAFLVEAGKKQKKEEQFMELERQIRDVVCDAEDTIDTCLTQTAANAATASKTRNMARRLIGSQKSVSLAKEVRTLRTSKVRPMFDKAKVDFATMEIGDGSAADIEASWKKPGKTQLIRQDNVVSLEDEELKIKGYLKEETEKLDVISIIGMPGLGKTTLAWKIFNDKAIQFAFPTRIWVYVSQDFNLRDVLLKILKGFTDIDMSGNTNLDLAQAVRAYLDQGKFLLVMDDVWDVAAWKAIEPVLPKENKKSKVLITSRYQPVGTHANPIRIPHRLRFLTEEESWKLLQYEVFEELDSCPKDLKGTGEFIAKQCDGLPLAIVVIGGILVDHFSTTRDMSAIQNAWSKVSENVNSYVKNDREERVANIVALSYKNLSDELRNCFLYLGMFPEDHEIPVWTLTRLWIAEGFIQHKDGESLEETAEGNLNDLINRNLVMVEKTNPGGEVKTCRVHDVIREFCNSKAGIKEQNMFQEVKMSKEGVFDPPVSDMGARRLCIHSHIQDFLLQKQLKGPKIRSFLCCNKRPFTLGPNCNAIIPETFKLLRVLESKSFKFTQFPPRVPRLIHLRYITLSFDDLDVLPDSIAELWNLQTFLINTKSRILTIKANIWKLMQLRHLKTKAAIVLAVPGEGDQACNNLQTLTRLLPENCTREVFNRAPNIKRLGIRGKLAELLNKEKYSLAALGRLENLKMVNDLPYGSPSENRLPDLPQANFFPVSLKRLTLSDTYLDWSRMSILGSIRSLQVLKLKDNAFTGQLWNSEGHGFHALQFLLIWNSDFVFWKASTGDFTRLRSIVLKNCENLREIPEGMESLQKLSLDCVGKSGVECAKKIKQDKELMHGQQQAKWSGFELKLGPGCE